MDADLPDQLVDAPKRGELALFCEMGVTQGGEDGLVAENLLHFQQVNTPLRSGGWHSCGADCVA